MIDTIWFGATAGLSIGVLYTVSSFVTVRYALGKSNRLFMTLVLGGMAVRLFVTMLILALILALAPVHRTALVAGFFIAFMAGLIIEIRSLHRSSELRSGKLPETPAPEAPVPDIPAPDTTEPDTDQTA